MGLVVGLIARGVMAGVRHIGFIATTLVGNVSSVVGAAIGGVVSEAKEGAKFHPAGFILLLVGAVLLLFPR